MGDRESRRYEAPIKPYSHYYHLTKEPKTMNDHHEIYNDRGAVSRPARQESLFDIARHDLDSHINGLLDTLSLLEEKAEPILGPDMSPSETRDVDTEKALPRSEVVEYIGSQTQTVRAIQRRLKLLMDRLEV